MFGRDLAGRNPFLAQPPAELADEEGLLPIGNLRIPAISEVFGIRLEIRSQRPLDPKPRAPLSTCPLHRPNPFRPAPIDKTMPTDFHTFTTGEAKMHAELGIVPNSAYDLVLEPYQG